jgi:rubrerythrin
MLPHSNPEDRMDQPKHECDHTCPRDCQQLNQILVREAAVERMYEQLLQDCDFPDIHHFVAEELAVHRQHVRSLEERINRLYTSFDPAGC